jgi:uncharacterized membrane protein
MQPPLKRGELEQLAKFYSLDQRRIEMLFELSGARPTRAEGLVFLGKLLRIGGILSLAASLVFFVAANWSRFEVFGRFALIELVLVGCAVVACIKPPPSFVGRGALFLAFVATGGLLALFGQTYQTGADIYELFLMWSLLGLPLVFVARWSVATAAWVLVLNLALLLFCGWQPAGGLLWSVLGGARFRTPPLFLGAAVLNVVLWFALENWRHEAAPAWVRRLLVSCAFGFGTWAGIMAAFDGGRLFQRMDIDPATLLGIAAIMVAVAWYTLKRREDIYPLAVVMGTFIIVGMAWVARLIEFADEGALFVLAVWLIITSTVGSRILLALMRDWRARSAA